MSVVLARRSHSMTSIARTHTSLEHLDTELRDAACVHHRIACDYRDSESFVRNLRRALAQCGPCALAVGWFHDEEPAQQLARVLSGQRCRTDFFHVRGSAVADPSLSLAERREPFDSLPDLGYHQIWLGFQCTGSATRWLTDAEIATGVLAAIAAGEPEFLVGRRRPGSSRPG